jgi:hypothetical protein
METYTYTIYYAPPHDSSGTEWDTHTEVQVEAESDAEARDAVLDVMRAEAADLSPADGYAVGDMLYALVWGEDGSIVSNPTLRLEADGVGLVAVAVE